MSTESTELSDPKTQKLLLWLIKQAIEARLVTYEEAAGVIDVPAWRPALSLRLGNIAKSSYKTWGVHLTSLVVKKHEGAPGDGFYKMINALSKEEITQDDWPRMAREVHEYFKPDYTNLIEYGASNASKL